MTGATITVTQVEPQGGMSLIYFTGTTDGDKKLDFSDYKSVVWIDAVDTTTLAKEAAAAYTAGGDITFSNATNAVAGLALVTL